MIQRSAAVLLLTVIGLAACGDGGASGSSAAEPTSGQAADDGAPLLVPAVWPEVIPAGTPTEVFLSVAPRGTVEGPVTYTVGTWSGTLEDDGGVYTAELEVTAVADLEVRVSATVDGGLATGAATVVVSDSDLPSGPAGAPVEPQTITAPDGGAVLADRVVFRMSPEAADDDVRSAAEAVGGTVIGRLSGTRWQIEIAPVGSWEELGERLGALEGQPGLDDVHPVGVGDLDP
jgi:hypothetical protein